MRHNPSPWRLAGLGPKQGSDAVAKELTKPHGMALEVIYRAESRCKSSGAPVGAFPKPPRGQDVPRSGPKSMISGPTPTPPENTTKKRLTALELARTDQTPDQTAGLESPGTLEPESGPVCAPVVHLPLGARLLKGTNKNLKFLKSLFWNQILLKFSSRELNVSSRELNFSSRDLNFSKIWCRSQDFFFFRFL